MDFLEDILEILAWFKFLERAIINGIKFNWKRSKGKTIFSVLDFEQSSRLLMDFKGYWEDNYLWAIFTSQSSHMVVLAQFRRHDYLIGYRQKLSAIPSGSSQESTCPSFTIAIIFFLQPTQICILLWHLRYIQGTTRHHLIMTTLKNEINTYLRRTWCISYGLYCKMVCIYNSHRDDLYFDPNNCRRTSPGSRVCSALCIRCLWVFICCWNGGREYIRGKYQKHYPKKVLFSSSSVSSSSPSAARSLLISLSLSSSAFLRIISLFRNTRVCLFRVVL